MIRFKIKHLLGAIGFLIVFTLVAYMAIPSLMLSIAEKYRQQGNYEAAKVYYDRMDRFFRSSASTAKALERAAEISSTNQLLMITPRSTGSANNVPGLLTEEALYYYKELVNRFPTTFEGRRALMPLTLHVIMEAIQHQEIHLVMPLTKEYYAKSKWPDTMLAIQVARLLQANRHYENAIELLEFSIENSEQYGSSPMHYEALADIYFVLGDANTAETLYKKVLAIYDENERLDRLYHEQNQDNIPRNMYLENKEAIQNKIDRLALIGENTGKITGTIQLTGKPLPNTHIVLHPLTNYHTFTSNSMDALWTVSDKHGQFTFDHLIPGLYTLGIVVDLNIVGDVILEGGHFPQSFIYVNKDSTHHWDFSLVPTMTALAPINNAVIEGDSIEFQWESFPEASYYTLEFGMYLGEGGSSSSPGSTKYYTNSATISVSELNTMPRGYSFDSDGPTPESLFGYAMPGGRYFWNVRAHAEDGRILTASQGYLKSQNTDYTFPKDGMLAGDHLLMKRKYGDAIRSYEQVLQNDPNNVHALRMLGALHRIDIGVEHANYPYTDFSKALAYFERLYQLTNEASILDTITGIYYYNLNDFARAKETLERYAEKQPLNDWQLFMAAMLESYEGDYNKALNYIRNSNVRFHMAEGALRIITGDMTRLSNELRQDPVQSERHFDHRGNNDDSWLSALTTYQQLLQVEVSQWTKDIQGKPVADAIDYLKLQSQSPVKEFLVLSLQVVDPSYRKEIDTTVDTFIKKHRTSNPDLAELVKALYQETLR